MRRARAFCTLRSTFARRKRHEPGGAETAIRRGAGPTTRRLSLAATHRGLADGRVGSCRATSPVLRRRRIGRGGGGAWRARTRSCNTSRLASGRALTHYESSLGRRATRTRTRTSDASDVTRTVSVPATVPKPPRSNPRRGRSCLQGQHLRVGARGGALIAQRPAARAELAEARAAAAWRLGRWDSLEGFLGVLDANAGGAGIAQGAGGSEADGRPGGGRGGAGVARIS